MKETNNNQPTNVITLSDKLKLKYRTRIAMIKIDYPVTIRTWYAELRKHTEAGNLPISICSELVLHGIIKKETEAYDMFYTDEYYEEQWRRYVEEEQRWESESELN